jgi:hypothetical protein
MTDTRKEARLPLLPLEQATAAAEKIGIDRAVPHPAYLDDAACPPQIRQGALRRAD